MLYPVIGDYNDYTKYFQDFYVLNKSTGTPMSFRNLAKKLNWPFSYFSDVVHGRKSLTTARAIEFAQFAKFNSVETERLVFMTLKASGHEGVHQFFTAKLEKGHNADIVTDAQKIHAGYPNDYETCIDELKNDIHSGVLLKYLIWCKGQTLKKNVSKLLFSFPEFLDMDFLEKRIDRLVRNGNIEILKNDEASLRVKILKPAIFFQIDSSNIHNTANFTDNMGKILRNDKVRGFVNNGFVRVRGQHLQEAMERTSILRNWLLELEKEEIPADEVSLLFQYEFNLASVIDTKLAGVKDIVEWGSLK